MVRPKSIQIDCTGLGGHDLGGGQPWHVCLRTDRHGQSIYGPSVAAIETVQNDGRKHPIHTVALGIIKQSMNSSCYTTLLQTAPVVGIPFWKST